MFETFLIIAIAVAAFYIGRRFLRNKKKVVTEKPAVLAVERAGVIAAYRREDLPEYNTGMLPPTSGLMVFSNFPIKGKVTGTVDDLHALLKESGRKLVLESPHSFYVPYTGGHGNSLARDAQNIGPLVLSKDAARARL